MTLEVPFLFMKNLLYDSFAGDIMRLKVIHRTLFPQVNSVPLFDDHSIGDKALSIGIAVIITHYELLKFIYITQQLIYCSHHSFGIFERISYSILTPDLLTDWLMLLILSFRVRLLESLNDET
jgi:hypothetical protein